MDKDLKVIYGVWFSVVAITFLLLPLIVSSPGPGWTYQEDANATALGGSWTNGDRTYDGDWDLYGTAQEFGTGYLYTNYSKLDGSLSTSLWQVKDRGATINLTLPVNCWDEDILQFQAKQIQTNGNAYWYCYNSSDWELLRTSDLSYNYIYEEAMWWNVTEAPADTCTCAGAGNDWEIDMSDYCNITEACDLTTGRLNFTGSGWCNCNASVNTTNLGDPGADGIIYIQDSCDITIN